MIRDDTRIGNSMYEELIRNIIVTEDYQNGSFWRLDRGSVYRTFLIIVYETGLKYFNQKCLASMFSGSKSTAILS